MKPLSAIALFVFLLLLGATWLKWVTAAVTVLGWVAVIVAIIIVLDTFVFHSDGWIGRVAPPQQ